MNLVYKGSIKEAPCKQACPAGIDVPRYISLIKDGKFAEAVAVVRERAPFPAVLGHVCPHFCEEQCRRAEIDESLAIKGLKRYASENDTGLWKLGVKVAPPTGKKVAIVGSGPAGLTAAYYLTRLGHSVTVFEAASEPGGMMRTGIPNFQLPQEVLDEEIKEIVSLGIELNLNSPIEDVVQLIENGYDAVLVAIGLQEGMRLPIPGNDLNGCLIGIDFLRDVSEGTKVSLGQNVLVLGGGGVACDVARTVRRLGVPKVAMACLESLETVPAPAEDIQQTEEEGIKIFPSRSFTRILGRDDRVMGVECLKVNRMAFDEEGRLQLETLFDSGHVLEADTVIFATGQRLKRQLVDRSKLELTKRGTIKASPGTMDTNIKGIFVSGDAVTGPASVPEAIATARSSAISIHRYLGCTGDLEEVLLPPEVSGEWPGFKEDILYTDRHPMPLLEGSDRFTSFAEVELGFTEPVAVEEASRCLRCDKQVLVDIHPDKCTACYRCQLVCSLSYQGLCNPEKARIKIRLPEIGWTEECVGGCALCIQRCPYGAVTVK
jgi:formate dehydrogenase beta subunit